MRSRNVESRQLGAWLFAGMTAPLAQFAGGISWQMVALTEVGCLSICWLVGRNNLELGKWLSLVELAWISIVLGAAGRWMAGSWTDGNVYPAVPLILLALGAASSSRGNDAAARAGSAVFWLVALVYSIEVAAGAGRVEWKELAAADRSVDLQLVAILLIPAVTVFLPGGKRRLSVGAAVAVGAFAAVLSVLVTGTLSLPVARSVESPFYEWVEGMNLAGTMQRFEAVASVGLTMGWFALVSLLLCVAGTLAKRTKEGSYRKGVWSAAVFAGIIMVSKVRIIPEIMVIGSLLLWVIVPLVMGVIDRNKKLKISENNA